MPPPSPDAPISDPLLRPDSAPRDASGSPVRAPLGNSIRTLLAFTVLVMVGVAVWWLIRPDDLTTRLGGREWVITEVDGQPATNAAGLVSTFILDGTGEIRATFGCNIAVGTWSYEPDSDRLDISWESQTELACPAEWPQTYRPTAGDVSMSGDTLSLESDTTAVRAVAIGAREPATVDDFAGTWVSGGQEVEIGRRGLFRIGECRGTWADGDEGMVVEFDHILPDACRLDPRWQDDTPIVPVVHDGVVYLRRDRAMFPLDRDIVRLDPPT